MGLGLFSNKYLSYKAKFLKYHCFSKLVSPFAIQFLNFRNGKYKASMQANKNVIILHPQKKPGLYKDGQRQKCNYDEKLNLSTFPHACHLRCFILILHF